MTSSLDTFKFRWCLMVSQHLFDFSNGPGRVQMLWTGLGTVHDRMAFEYRVGIIHFLQAFSLNITLPNVRWLDSRSTCKNPYLVIVTRIDQPSVSLLNDSWSKVLVTVPPVWWTGSWAASAQDALNLFLFQAPLHSNFWVYSKKWKKKLTS